MRLKRELDREFVLHTGKSVSEASSNIDKYVEIARGYAEIENTLTVLSNLSEHYSIVFHSKFSHTLDINIEKCSDRISSIWEEEIFRSIHPDDLEMKMLQELMFFHYVSRLPHGMRFEQCMMQRLRMRDSHGNWREVLHRLYYIPSADGKSLWLALCLYGPVTIPLPVSSLVVDTVSGKTVILDKDTCSNILSRQEIAVLKRIDTGCKSREIADELNISIHTVSRHRQNIIAKLKVRNSAEACRTARNLLLI